MERKNALQNHPDRYWLKVYAKYSGIGIQMIVIVIIGVWGGLWLDKFFANEKPLLTIATTLFSLIAAIYLMMRMVKK